MLGAIAGDIIGSIYEARPIKTKEFSLFERRSRFTDDSVLSIAVARAILHGEDYRSAVWSLGRRYPDAGYGGSFIGWLGDDNPEPYGSFGNGSAMRVAPVGFAFDDPATVLHEAERQAAISHDHPEGIKGAQAVALAVLLARTTGDREGIRTQIEHRFDYDLQRTVDDIRPGYAFDVTCQGSVPEAIVAFLDSTSYEDAVRNAVSLGGDSDTQACMAGGIAEAFYGLPADIAAQARARLTEELRAIVDEFTARFCAE
ncbi:MAG: ADP-ribosylglycohydrolase family protein [Halofilum sp. (in: g-proteobacteria)]